MKPIIKLDDLCAGLLDAAPDPLFVISEVGEIILVNRQAEQVFGYARESLLGQTVEALVPERYRTAHIEHRGAFHRTPRVRPMGSGLEITARRQDGTEFPAEISLSPIAIPGHRLVICTVRDVTERAMVQQRLRFLSTHDMLTGLYNRAFFEEERDRIERGRHFPVSLIVIDVDDMKKTNDTLGHAAGDELLRHVTAVLREIFRGDDIIARLGGDEFAALLPDTSEEGGAEILTRLQQGMLEHNLRAAPSVVQFSAGCATAQQGQSLAATFRQADLRMYENKLSKKGSARRSRPE